MSKSKAVICDTPNCSNTMYIRIDSKMKSFYCKDCKAKYPISLLKLQTKWDLLIPELFIKTAEYYNFTSGQGLSMQFGVSRQKLIAWLRKYLGVNSWIEFKKIYFCKSKSCYITDVSSFNVTKNPYYLIHKLKKEHNVCSCKYSLHKSEQPSGTLGEVDGSTKNKILIKITGSEVLEKIGLVSLEKKDIREKK